MYMRGLPDHTDRSNPDVAIIIPSTGRAEQCARLVERIHLTARSHPSIVVSIEPADAEPYFSRLAAAGDSVSLLYDSDGPGSGSHVTAINRAARDILDGSVPKIIIKLDDDHWPVTVGWDVLYLNALTELGGTGVVYGNDLFQGERLPTVPGLSTDIVRGLGWYAPPELGHLFVDNFWLQLGKRSGQLRYLPDTIIEHRHPDAFGAVIPQDDTYARGGMSPARWAADGAAWNEIISQPPTPRDRHGNRVGPDWPSQMDIWADRVVGLAARKGWKS